MTHFKEPTHIKCIIRNTCQCSHLAHIAISIWWLWWYTFIITICTYQSQNHKGCENLPSLHVWWVRRHHVIFRKNGFLTSRMTSQPLNRHTQWNNIFFPHIDVIHIVSEHLIGSLEESKVWFFLCKTAMFNY